MNAVPEPLNHPDPLRRLGFLKQLADHEAQSSGAPAGDTAFVNNHIHTLYSFSPYSPAMAVWLAKKAGLRSAGLMDHDSLAGAEEFVEAGRVAGLPVTIGVECRADFSATRLAGRSINHPDQPSVGYVAIHGIPHQCFQVVRDFFAPRIEARGVRNAAMAVKLNRALAPVGLSLDYEKDVVPLSQRARGGVVTERHLLYAAALKLIAEFGKGPALVTPVEEILNVPLSPKVKGLLDNPDNPYYAYDLLGALKSEFNARFYIEAKEECAPVEDVLTLARRIGAIMAYAYLGDIEESVTGDKKAQRFEDGYLELLFEELSRLKFQAVTYMPSRNTPAQLQRVQALCQSRGLLEISGEDINSPRQSFVCPALANPAFSHLVDMTWALIGHEKAATQDPHNGFFSSRTMARFPDLKTRIRYFKTLGQEDAATSTPGALR